MGGGSSSEKGEAYKASDGKPKQIRTIPIFGVASSGKSTVFKGLKLARAGGLSEDERRYIGREMQFKCINSVASVLEKNLDTIGPAAEEFQELLVTGEKMRDEMSALLNVEEKTTKLMNLAKQAWDTIDVVKEQISSPSLWTNHFSLMHIFSKIDAICAFDYLATDTDALCVRVATYEQNQLSYDVDGLQFNFRDFGGQRKLRGTWMKTAVEARAKKIHVPSLIFVLALDSFTQRTNAPEDAILDESEPIMEYQGGGDEINLNLMSETLCVLDLVAAQVFPNIPVVIYLNKIDLFAKALETADLKQVFPTYEGGSDRVAALAQIKQACLEKCGVNSGKRNEDGVTFIETNATDLALMKRTMEAIHQVFNKTVMANAFQ